MEKGSWKVFFFFRTVLIAEENHETERLLLNILETSAEIGLT